MIRENFYNIDAGAHCSRGERRELIKLEARRVGRSICYGGGGGGSSSSNTTTTANTDKRQVVDGQSVGVSSDSSTVNVSVLDNGAFSQAVDLAKGVGEVFTSNYQKLLDTTAALAQEGQKVLQANTDILAHMTGTSIGATAASSPGSSATDSAASSSSAASPLLLLALAAGAVFVIWKKKGA